jgi:hypothetical protein
VPLTVPLRAVVPTEVLVLLTVFATRG